MQNGGLRTKGITKTSILEKPLITIVTVVYNGAATLEQTIQSVVNQTYENVEYIIIDGASTDNTLDIIKKYEDKIDYWQSEPDKGIYDAMNKGINLSTGDWINFMNSGDFFSQQNVIKSIFESPRKSDVIYGDSAVITKSGKITNTRAVANSNFIYKGVAYRHGASFVKVEIHKANLFDQTRKDLGYALDFLCIYSLKIKGFIFEYIPINVMTYEEDGISNHPFKNAWYTYKITYKRKPFYAFIRFSYSILRQSMKSIKEINKLIYTKK